MAGDPYARVAAWYDTLLDPVLDEVRRAIVAVCRARGLPRVLDACCGTGRQCAALRGAGLTCVGADRSPAMLRVARTAVAPRHLLHADACALPFAAGRFDVVVLSLALHEMPEAMGNAVLAEALRVAPRVLLADYRLAERNLDLPAVLFAHLPERLAGREHYRNFRGFMGRGGVEGVAHGAGLSIRHRERLLGGAGALLLAERDRRIG